MGQRTIDHIITRNRITSVGVFLSMAIAQSSRMNNGWREEYVQKGEGSELGEDNFTGQ